MKCLRYIATHYFIQGIIDTQVPRGSWKYVHQGGLITESQLLTASNKFSPPTPSFDSRYTLQTVLFSKYFQDINILVYGVKG